MSLIAAAMANPAGESSGEWFANPEGYEFLEDAGIKYAEAELMRIRQALIMLITFLAAGGHYAYAQGYNATSLANITAYGERPITVSRTMVSH
jgi:hypothetical protein